MTKSRRAVRLLLTPFGLAVLGCLVLAGWALWSGGVLDGEMARTVRTSSVYAAPGVDLDTAAAEKIIGNRRLVVIMLEPGADLRGGCHAVHRAAAGTLVLLLSRDGDDFDTYGCSLFDGSGSEDFGKGMVAESVIGNGIDEFVDRPLGAVKVIAVNYDQLVKAGILPDDARTISPSLPHLLVAIAAVAGVLAGAVLLYAAALRAGRRTAAHRARRDRATDSRTLLSAAAATVAQQIIDLDPQYTTAVRADRVDQAGGGTTGTGRRPGAADRPAKRDRGGDPDRQRFAPAYRKLTSEYTRLLDDVAAADRRGEHDFSRFTARAEALAEKFRVLTAGSA